MRARCASTALATLAIALGCALLLAPAGAAAHTSFGGGSSGGGSESDADCLRWGEVDVAGADGATADGANGGGGSGGGGGAGGDGVSTTDAGVPRTVVLRCLEHATLFGCRCGLADRSGRGDGALASGVTLLAAVGLGLRRRRGGQERRR